MPVTRIEWADRVWEPVSGCTAVSEGCPNCYARTLAEGRLRRFYPEGFGKVTLHPERLDQPLHWRKPQRVFVCSRADLFHEDVPDSFLWSIFDRIARSPQHTFLVLTKRAQRMRDFIRIETEGNKRAAAIWSTLETTPFSPTWPLPNIWAGVSVENQRAAEERIDLLGETPAAVRFISAEPLLSRLNITGRIHRLNWVIAGGESGPGARRAELEWFRDLRLQCREWGIAFYMKQLGSVLGRELGCRDRRGADMDAWPEDLRIREYPK